MPGAEGESVEVGEGEPGDLDSVAAAIQSEGEDEGKDREAVVEGPARFDQQTDQPQTSGQKSAREQEAELEGAAFQRPGPCPVAVAPEFVEGRGEDEDEEGKTAEEVGGALGDGGGGLEKGFVGEIEEKGAEGEEGERVDVRAGGDGEGGEDRGDGEGPGEEGGGDAEGMGFAGAEIGGDHGEEGENLEAGFEGEAGVALPGVGGGPKPVVAEDEEEPGDGHRAVEEEQGGGEQQPAAAEVVERAVEVVGLADEGEGGADGEEVGGPEAFVPGSGFDAAGGDPEGESSGDGEGENGEEGAGRAAEFVPVVGEDEDDAEEDEDRAEGGADGDEDAGRVGFRDRPVVAAEGLGALRAEHPALDQTGQLAMEPAEGFFAHEGNGGGCEGRVQEWRIRGGIMRGMPAP